MPGRYLLDTNAAIALLNADGKIGEPLRGADGIYLPAASAGKLDFGAYNSARTAANLARVDAFIGANVLIASDGETGRLYGEIKAGLRAAGRPVPDNDLWIAATAMQHDLTLVTRDAHFDHVSGLPVRSW